MEVGAHHPRRDPAFEGAGFRPGGAGRWGRAGVRIMTRELLPNIMAPLLVAATLKVAAAVLLESYISYLRVWRAATTRQLGGIC